MPPRQHIEQRTTRRIPLRVQVTYQVMDDFLSDYLANLSAGGMFITSERPLPEGTRFRLSFLLPGDTAPVRTYATVRWSVRPGEGPRSGMGVQFDPLPDRHRERVEGWLEDQPD